MEKGRVSLSIALKNSLKNNHEALELYMNSLEWSTYEYVNYTGLALKHSPYIVFIRLYNTEPAAAGKNTSEGQVFGGKKKNPC